ncbi:MAG: sigma-70 family RNA polymerase sigma factor [Bacteroidales bacterium]|nr:sigma-70 family RNA polymerase sigma factor [Bacteroidales bacterium]MBN2819664.1 sigma-70 family RNA polymerase sigma factor [Bacteroidales bacterium]
MSKLQLGQILSGIRKRDQKVLSEIYRHYYPVVLGYIIRHGGGEAEAKDVFQETILVIFKYSDEEKLDIKGDFGAYLIGISKRLWLRILRQQNTHDNHINQLESETFEEHPSDKEIDQEVEYAFLRKHIVKLGEECQKVLMMTAEGLTNSEIAEKMNYKSVNFVGVKKVKCKRALIKLIKNDPDYQDWVQ